MYGIILFGIGVTLRDGDRGYFYQQLDKHFPGLKPVIPSGTGGSAAIPAEIGLAYCNKLFFIERGLKNLPPDERRAKRLEKEPAVWSDFWKWLLAVHPTGGSKLEKAVNYAQNHRDTLCN